MNLNEEPKKKAKIRINPGAMIIAMILCLGGGYWLGKENGKQNETALGQSSLGKIEEVYNILKNDWLNVSDEINLDDVLAKAMVEAVNDPYNSCFTPEELTQFENTINKNYEGIGVAFNTAAGVPVITQVYVGSSAEAAGLKMGDILLEADHQDLSSLTSTEIAQLIKGNSGTTVLLKVKRDQEEFEVTLKRAPVDYSAIYEIKEANGKKFGLIHLSSFGTTTDKEVAKALAYFKTENIETIVIDLRNNTGGYLQSAKGILDLFLSKGQTEFSTEDKNGKQVIYQSENNDPYKFVNGYILVNENTASASEVVAGSLQELLGYQLIGTKTYGKGVVQTQVTLSDLSVVKYTSSRWMLPSGKNINEVGLSADIEVNNIDASHLYDFEVTDPLKTDMVDLRVQQMQMMLKLLGYHLDREDGYFNESTKEALIEFEKNHGLEVNGELSDDDRVILIKEVILYINDENNDQQYQKLLTLIK